MDIKTIDASNPQTAQAKRKSKQITHEPWMYSIIWPQPLLLSGMMIQGSVYNIAMNTDMEKYEKKQLGR